MGNSNIHAINHKCVLDPAYDLKCGKVNTIQTVQQAEGIRCGKVTDIVQILYTHGIDNIKTSSFYSGVYNITHNPNPTSLGGTYSTLLVSKLIKTDKVFTRPTPAVPLTGRSRRCQCLDRCSYPMALNLFPMHRHRLLQIVYHGSRLPATTTGRSRRRCLWPIGS